MTNVVGTNNVLLSAIEHKVKNVVVLSTDKAAYPINAMGISKALMEKVAIAKGRELGEGAETTICCTRYGNVMASRGSVIPLWVEQMIDGKPITITDPNMTEDGIHPREDKRIFDIYENIKEENEKFAILIIHMFKLWKDFNSIQDFPELKNGNLEDTINSIKELLSSYNPN